MGQGGTLFWIRRWDQEPAAGSKANEECLTLRTQKNDRQRQSRGWNDDSSSLYGNAPDPVSYPSLSATSSAPEMDGSVNWYNAEKGFGFVALADGSGDVFLHVSALQAAGVQAVAPGALLKVRVGQGQKGRQVDQVLSVTEGPILAQTTRRPQGGRSDSPEQPRRQVDLGVAIEVAGAVKWYNPEKGFGFISLNAGGKDAFIHATVVERAGLVRLTEGQSVWVGVVQGTKGPEAASIGLR